MGLHPVTRESWLAQTTSARWKVFRARLKGCREKPSTGSVHELRVATRRLISQVTLLQALFPGAKTAWILRFLKKQVKLLGGLRDHHVQTHFIRERLTRFPEVRVLERHLARREGKLAKKISRNLENSRIGKFKKRFRSLTNHIGGPAAPTEAKVTECAVRLATAAFEEALRKHRLATCTDLRTVHQARIAFRRYRYLVETLPGEVTGWKWRDLRNLASHQRRMGLVQDLLTVEDLVRCFGGKDERVQKRLAAFRSYLNSRRGRALRRLGKPAVQLLRLWPPNWQKCTGDKPVRH